MMPGRHSVTPRHHGARFDMVLSMVNRQEERRKLDRVIPLVQAMASNRQRDASERETLWAARDLLTHYEDLLRKLAQQESQS